MSHSNDSSEGSTVRLEGSTVIVEPSRRKNRMKLIGKEETFGDF